MVAGMLYECNLNNIYYFHLFTLESSSRYICEAAVDADKNEKGKGNVH